MCHRSSSSVILINYSCVHNQIATFGLFGRQSVTLNIGLNISCSHNRDNRPSEQSVKCNIGQALIYVCMYACMYICMYGWMDVCIYIHIYMYVCMDVCMYLCVCMYVHLCIYTYIQGFFGMVLTGTAFRHLF